MSRRVTNCSLTRYLLSLPLGPPCKASESQVETASNFFLWIASSSYETALDESEE